MLAKSWQISYISWHFEWLDFISLWIVFRKRDTELQNLSKTWQNTNYLTFDEDSICTCNAIGKRIPCNIYNVASRKFNHDFQENLQNIKYIHWKSKERLNVFRSLLKLLNKWEGDNLLNLLFPSLKLEAFRSQMSKKSRNNTRKRTNPPKVVVASVEILNAFSAEFSIYFRTADFPPKKCSAEISAHPDPPVL